MDWDRIEKNWQYYKQLAKQRWAKITPDELDIIAGSREALADHIEDVYRISHNAAQMQVESWQGQQRDSGLGAA